MKSNKHIVWLVKSNPEVSDGLLVELLLAKGANPKLRSNNVTPLMDAAHEGDRDIVELLLRYGAERSAKSGNYTAADYVGHYGNEDLLDLLEETT